MIRMAWSNGVVLITTVQLYSTNPEIGFSAFSNPAHRNFWELNGKK